MRKILTLLAISIAVFAKAQTGYKNQVVKDIDVKGVIKFGTKTATKISDDTTLSQKLSTALVTERAVKSYVDTRQAYINVKQFGAKGDGVTNDVAAIQAAINSLKYTGGVLFFPRGNYRILSSIVLSKTNTSNDYNNITLIGEGKVSQISAVPNNADTSLTHLIKIFSTVAGSPIKNTIIRDLFFNGNATTQMGGGTPSGGLYHGGVEARNVDGFKCENSYFEGCGTMAIYCGRYEVYNDRGAKNCVINNNIIMNSFADAIYCQINSSCKIINNHIENSGTGVEHFAIIVEGLYHSTITNNTVKNCTNGIMANNSSTKQTSISTISNNTVEKTESYGIYIAGCYGITVTANTCSYNKECGILVFRADGIKPTQNQSNIISNNIINSSYKAGIGVGDSYNQIISNTIINSNYRDSAVLEMDKSAIVLVYGASNNVISNNVFFNVLNNEDAEENGYIKYGVWLEAGSNYNILKDNTINSDGIYQSELYHSIPTTSIITGKKYTASFTTTVAANSVGYYSYNMPPGYYRVKLLSKMCRAAGDILPGVFVEDWAPDTIGQINFSIKNTSVVTQPVHVYFEVEGY